MMSQSPGANLGGVVIDLTKQTVKPLRRDDPGLGGEHRRVEAIDRVEEQLHANHPNLALMCRFLNSIARSLRAQPEARDACLLIEDAIGKAGMPSTWQSGI